jgi:hypothetical protein
VQGQQVVTRVLTDQHSVRTGAIVAAWVLAAITLGYLVPYAVAVSRGKSNSGAIFVVNLFAGWTVIGWIVALVMAAQAHRVAGYASPVAPSPAPQRVSEVAATRPAFQWETTYSTAEWSRDELREIKASLDERGVDARSRFD